MQRDAHYAILDTIPLPAAIIDRDLRIIHANEAGRRTREADQISGMPFGVVLGCAAAEKFPDHENCHECQTRKACERICAGATLAREPVQTRIPTGVLGKKQKVWLSGRPIPDGGNGKQAVIVVEKSLLLLQDSGIITLCAHCQKIRGEQGVWISLESLLREQIGLLPTHSYCPECAARLGFR